MELDIMDNGTLYSTIATINGVWISLLFSLGLVLLTYIVNQNIIYFTSIRAEKKNMLDSHIALTSMADLSIDIGKFNDTQDDKVASDFSKLLKSIELEYDEEKFKNIGLADKTNRIRNDMRSIISYYPQPEEPQLTFKYSKKASDADIYNEWLQKYKARINPIELEKAFMKISNADPINCGSWIEPKDKITLQQIRPMWQAFTRINNSIEKIETLHTDYESVEIIVRQIIPISYGIIGILIFGIFLPMYMLLPFRLNVLPEYVMIGIIFIPVTILYFDLLKRVYKIVKPLLL